MSYDFSLLAPASHPSNSTGYALNSTHIYLTWDPPPPEDVNGVIREYRINITEIETGDLRQFTTPPNVRELVVGPLHPYYSYRSTIVAFTIEVGPYSTAITVRTEEDGERIVEEEEKGMEGREREKGREGGREGVGTRELKIALSIILWRPLL